jgi:hypothetical protein
MLSGITPIDTNAKLSDTMSIAVKRDLLNNTLTKDRTPTEYEHDTTATAFLLVKFRSYTFCNSLLSRHGYESMLYQVDVACEVVTTYKTTTIGRARSRVIH